MGKKSRLKKLRRMGEKMESCQTETIINSANLNNDFKESKPEEKNQKIELKERQMVGYYLTKNLEAMKVLGWDKTGLIDKIKSAPNTVIKIDPGITLSGVKNPLTSVFVGFSTRKLYDAMLRKKKIVKFTLIIEPNLSSFKHLIGCEDITDLLLSKDVEFVVGKTGEELLPEVFRSFTKQLNGMMVSRSTVIESMNIVLDPFQYNTPELIKKGEKEIELIHETCNQLKLSMGCSDDQFRRFQLLIENKKNMYNSWKISGLYDKFKGATAIVLGGGPSLESFINEYKSNPDLKNATIIAADAVLFKLLQAGIKPHLVPRCERKLTNIFKGVTKEMTKGVYFCAYPWTPPEYFELFEDSFYLFRQNGVCLFTELSHGFVDGGVSSANAALELAINLGFDNIVMSGVDCCFIGGKTHVDGTQVEFNINKSKDKWFELPTNNGKTATSIPVWERTRNEYFQSIDKWTRKGKNFTVYNTSLEGAVINGTKVTDWKDIGHLFKNTVDVNKVITDNRSKLTQEEIDKFEKKIVDSLAKLKEYKQQCTIAIGLAEDARRTAEGELNKLVRHVSSTANNAYEHVRMIRQNIGNYDKLWSGVSDAYDQNFKNKLYIEGLFRVLIFDVLQLDLYHTENRCNAVWNETDFSDERHYLYYTFTKEFALKVEYYLEQFIKLFS